MSRSTADWQLRLEAAAWVLDTPAGTRRVDVGDDPARALDGLAADAPARGAGLRVVLADGWLRYLVVHWPPQVRKEEERRVFMAHRFQAVHGVAAPDWVLSADADAIRFPALCCAVPAALLDAVRAFAGRLGARLQAVGGDFADSYNRLQGNFDEALGQPAALALMRQGRCTVGLWCEGAWIAVRSQAVGEHGAAAVRRMVELMKPPATAAGGVLYAVGVAAAPEGWRLRALQEGGA